MFQIKHKLLLLYSWLVRSMMFFFPDMPLFMRIRGFLYGLGMNRCGRNFQITHNATLRCLENMVLGRDVYFANNVLILATASLTIEDEVMLGPNVVVVNWNHARFRSSYRFKTSAGKPIFIGFGSWVGANAVIVCGGSLPKSSVLGANSVLNRRFTEEGSLICGSPADIIQRKNEPNNEGNK